MGQAMERLGGTVAFREVVQTDCGIAASIPNFEDAHMA
jgi:hypothetical protein